MGFTSKYVCLNLPWVQSTSQQMKLVLPRHPWLLLLFCFDFVVDVQVPFTGLCLSPEKYGIQKWCTGSWWVSLDYLRMIGGTMAMDNIGQPVRTTPDTERASGGRPSVSNTCRAQTFNPSLAWRCQNSKSCPSGSNKMQRRQRSSSNPSCCLLVLVALYLLVGTGRFCHGWYIQ